MSSYSFDHVFINNSLSGALIVIAGDFNDEWWLLVHCNRENFMLHLTVSVAPAHIIVLYIQSNTTKLLIELTFRLKIFKKSAIYIHSNAFMC